MSRYNPHHDNQPLFDLAERWRDQSLLAGNGLLISQKIWTVELIDEVIDRFVNNPDEGERSFVEKFRDQLASASPEACLLAAEVFYVMLLCPSNINVQTKVDNVRAVWELSGVEFPEGSPLLGESYLGGVGSAGTGYNNHRFREMTYALYALQAILKVPEDKRKAMLSDGDAFAEFLEQVPENEQRQFRHMLLHILFPDNFERIFGGTDRSQALRALTGKTPKEIRAMTCLAQDKGLRQIREEAEKESGKPVDFYEDPLHEKWGKREPNSWLFSWNPKNFEWADIGDERKKLMQGKEVTLSWACANSNVAVGDTAYLLRTGIEPKGIIASGNIISEPYQGPHWDEAKADAGDTQQYVDIELKELRDPAVDSYVSLSDLENIKVDQQHWNPQQSGIQIAARSAKVLAKLWSKLEPVKVPAATKETPRVALSPAKNVIFYGPPGTGKTHEMKRLASNYEDAVSRLSSEQWLGNNLEDAAWWQVILMSLIDLGGKSQVSDIILHPYFQAKARLMGRTSTNLRATCWASLQSHAVLESETVQYKVELRRAPFVFDKKNDGTWFLTGDWQESCAEWAERHAKIKAGPAGQAEVRRRYEMVTFHQSYSYEDFVEGIRPVPNEDGNGVIYEVKEGLFKRLCAKAKADPEKRYALFIDEINRGNVARILGEIITLIEPDKRANYKVNGEFLPQLGGMEVTLPYSGVRFGVPANLDVYGAMNTADRSIAPLDAALRRRFEFKEVLPDAQKIGGERGDGYIPDGEGGVVDLRELLIKINQRVEYLVHRDQTIGHAFFMKVKDIQSLRAVIVGAIIPQLQEYFYNDWSRIQMVFGDHQASSELQIVRKITRDAQSLFGALDEDFPDAVYYEVAEEKKISPDAIRKIYQPDS